MLGWYTDQWSCCDDDDADDNDYDGDDFVDDFVPGAVQ